jgi:Reverse transcriptase (RNA-dependent DNA polymerase)
LTERDLGKLKGTVLHLYHMACQVDTGFQFKYCSILDSGSSLHVFNNLRRFENFRKAQRGDYLIAGLAKVPILGYGEVMMQVESANAKPRKFRLKNVAYCPEFATNIVSYDLLEERGFRWDTKSNYLVRNDNTPVCQVKKKGRYRILENVEGIEAVFPALAVPKYRRRTQRPRPKSPGSGDLWHLRMGHVGPQALRQLGSKSLGVHLKGPATHKCSACAGAKIHRMISRRGSEQGPTRPFARVHLDWTPLEESVDGFVRAMFLTCELTGMMFVYFCKSYDTGVSLANLQDFQALLKTRYSLGIRTIRTDGELAKVKKVAKWLSREGISLETSPPHTQDQNGRSERAGAVIIMKSRSMRLSAKLPHDLWVEMVHTAVYLYNRTPKAELGWESPYEHFYSWLADNHEIEGRRKPQLAHLKAYGCKAYAMTADAKLKRNRLQKLNPRAHIGYLVGYDSTNIYRIWVPHRGEVISSRDVFFDEDEFFDGKKLDLDDGLAKTLDEYVHQVRIPEQASRNEVILQEDDEIVDLDPSPRPDQPDGLSDQGEEMDTTEDQEISQMSGQQFDLDELPRASTSLNALGSTGFRASTSLNALGSTEFRASTGLNESGSTESIPRASTSLNALGSTGFRASTSLNALGSTEDVELQSAILQGCLTPPATEKGALEDFVGLTVRNPARSEGVREDGYVGSMENMLDSEVNEPELSNRAGADDDRFEGFKDVEIATAWQGAIMKGRKFKAHKRDLPPPPENYKEFQKHPLKEAFEKAQHEHLKQHAQKGSWQTIDRKQAKGHQILSSMWVFVYKTDKHGFLVKCKARLVVCGNQQKLGDLPTRATTLAGNTLRTLLAIAAKFDLELKQLDVVNAFVNCELDEVVFMKMPPGFEEYGKVCRLRKALYGLRRSPLLWQRKLTDTFKSMGFREIPQEPCAMMKGGVIVFFYVDDIVFAYRKKHEKAAEQAKKELEKSFELTDSGDLKWFLGIHVVRDRANRSIWLSQAAYIDKITSQFRIDISGKLPETPMLEEELKPSPQKHRAGTESRDRYQRKVGSILFAAISTRPDIAFAASRLARYNQNPDDLHQEAADRVLKYLYATRNLCIRYGHENSGESFICSSDSSFADNSVDRKSSQGYAMILFGGAIGWRANKQNTVTTSSTEAELLALSQTAKEGMFMSRLFKALSLELNEPLSIRCDNRQTLRLFDDSIKLVTKLRHVDVHNHWLRQECKRGTIQLKWEATNDMIADGMTKSLGKQKFNRFVKLLRLEDQTVRLELIKREEELKDELKTRREAIQGREAERTVAYIKKE